MSEAKRKEWAAAQEEGRRRNRHYGSRKRTSKHELALVPYMQALGYQHDTGKRIGHKVPDFVDHEGKRIYEYFGSYWHEPGDDQRLIEFYALRGWQCTVLWEYDLFDWLRRHEPLVTPAQHAVAWKVAHVNNGYRKPIGAGA
jgi:G:T-mismatch repair DNA endonuclease (very short patch repair protein)